MDDFMIPNLSSACSELHLSNELSAWYGHIPFAFWIANLLKPKIIVELGTHYGISYTSFCESVKKNNLDTKAYAVDTWIGDPHAGYYGEEVYLKFKEYHDQHYSEFSTLMRMTFDEALHQFSDQSIDLLHIDGLHTYEAVKHDFQTWLPKLSNKAVVLFHDTCVEENNFGVYQLWQELTAQYPAFNFTHSYGLGVLLFGEKRDPFLKKIADLEKEKFQASSFNSLFQQLGANYELKYSLYKHQSDLAEQEETIKKQKCYFDKQEAIIREKDLDLERKEIFLREKENLINQKDKLIREQEKKLKTKEEELLQQENLVQQQQKLISEKEDQIQSQIGILQEKDSQLAEKDHLIEQKNILLTEKERELIENSRLIFKIKNTKMLRYNLQLLNFLERIKTVFENRAVASYIARSNLFDRAWYLEQYPDVKQAGVDPLWHYINFGAYEGRNPGPLFDTNWYLQKNGDVKDSKMNPFLHFLLHGRHEGRLPNPHFNTADCLQKKSGIRKNRFLSIFYFIFRKKRDRKETDYYRISHFLKKILPFPKNKEVVVVFGHEASRTGAPIALLGIIRHLSRDPKLQVITILKRGGPLLADYQNVCQTLVLGDVLGKTFTSSAINTKYFEWIAEHLESLKHQVTCLCNTVDSKEAVEVFGKRGFSIFSLIHEMPTSINKWFGGASTIKVFDQYSQKIIFPSRFTHEQVLREYKIDKKKSCVIHPSVNFAYPETERLLLREKFLNEIKLPNNTILVVGCGAYDYRKGFDLFIQAGKKSILESINGNQPVPIFLWVGTYFGCDYATKQIATIPKNIKQYFIFLDERSSVEKIIAAANTFFLSSREDPFPLVALEAAGYDVPIVLFSGATGIEKTLPQKCYYVANNFDINSVYPVLANALNQSEFQGCSSFIRKEFSSKKYAEKIALQLTRAKLVSTVDPADSLSLKVIPYLSKVMKRFAEIGKLLRSRTRNAIKSTSLAQNTVEQATLNSVWAWPCDYGKKPIPEFHPGIYKEECMSLEDRTDPFNHFLQAGKPQGRWISNLLSNKVKNKRTTPLNLRIGLHIHVFYENLFTDIIERLELNEVTPDLLITIPKSILDTKKILETLKKYPGKVKIYFIENRGRDIGAFLTELGASLIDEYDIIGHLHTKKSIHVADSIAKEWREFLLENLLGGRLPMADIIIEAMAKEEKIGLVFPSDPYTNGWDKNRTMGKELLLRLGINNFYEQFNFPIGTMFWARTLALKPLLDLKLTYQDYPEEPIPSDGTILHALERVIPFVIEKEGYQSKMTHVEGVTR